MKAVHEIQIELHLLMQETFLVVDLDHGISGYQKNQAFNINRDFTSFSTGRTF